jgi:pimeloyl-ACP methyl ester carboxylesterase
MTESKGWIRLMVLVGAVVALSGYMAAQQTVQIAGAPCVAPPFLHCPDKDCSPDRVINPGPVVEMKSRRTYFLDYPCDLKPGEKVTFILSLHGAGSYGNWQRHYFPLVDYKDKYRLVIATPNSPTRIWSDADDEYLQNIVTFVVSQIGKENIKAFWLVGHSQGGLTSNRLVRTPFFKDRVDGWLSLSGGRIGGLPGRSATWGPPPAPASAMPVSAPAPSALAAAVAALKEPPPVDFSFIFETGQHEMDDKGLPETSDWATRLGCGPRGKATEIADTQAGYVYDSTRQNPGKPSWGLLPGPGKADVYAFGNCKDGRVVADAVRLNKGHTEGLEPKITEDLVQLMVSAKGGRIQAAP